MREVPFPLLVLVVLGAVAVVADYFLFPHAAGFGPCVSLYFAGIRLLLRLVAGVVAVAASLAALSLVVGALVLGGDAISELAVRPFYFAAGIYHWLPCLPGYAARRPPDAVKAAIISFMRAATPSVWALQYIVRPEADDSVMQIEYDVRNCDWWVRMREWALLPRNSVRNALAEARNFEAEQRESDARQWAAHVRRDPFDVAPSELDDLSALYGDASGLDAGASDLEADRRR